MKRAWVGLWIAILTAVAYAGETELFVNDTSEAFGRGKLQDVQVNAEGILRLSPEMKELLGEKETMFWCLAVGDEKTVYAGTSDGKVIRVRPGPKAVLTELPKVGVFSLVWQQGVLYAGTGPGGVIYRLKEGSKPEKFCETKEDYVWVLVSDGQGNLLAGTGNEGKVLRIDVTGKATTILETREPHVLAVAVGSKGTVYASTDGKGLVYRIAVDGSSVVAYDAAESEIRCMMADGTGGLYFGTADVQSGRRRAEGPPTGSGGPSVKGASAARTRARTVGGSGDGSVSATNAIYRMDGEGMVLKLANLENLMVLSMAWTSDGLYFGTGNSGRLGLIEKDQELTWVKEDLESQVLSLVRSGEGELLSGTGGEGRVLAMGPGRAAEGTYLSQVFDGGFVSKFGVISWRGRKPADTEIEVTTRSGNVDTVDDSWSDFSKPYADQEGSVITNPPARFIQYRVRLTSKGGKAGSEVEEVRIAYLPTNQPPRVEEVAVDGQEEGDQSKKGKLPKGAEAEEKGKHTIAWKAEDPNGDKLEYTVSFRGVDEDAWVTMKQKTEEEKLTWDTEAVPDGYYRVKVVASDAPSNAGKRAMTGERVSKPVLVDNTAPGLKPLVVAKTGKESVQVKTSALDTASRIASAAYSVDSGDWKLLEPVDGLLDQKSEEFDFEVNGLAIGQHVVSVRVSDQAGNTAAVRGTVEVK